MVNKATVDLMRDLLNLPEHVFSATEVKTAIESDVEALLDFLIIVCLVLFTSLLVCEIELN